MNRRWKRVGLGKTGPALFSYMKPESPLLAKTRKEVFNIIDVRKNVRYNLEKKGVTPVDTINITSARKNLYQLVKKTNLSHVPVLITGKEGDAVLLSGKDWRAIEETMYLNSVPGLADSILAAEAEPKETRLNADAVDW